MQNSNKLVYVLSFLISCIALNAFAIDFLSSKTAETAPKKQLMIFSATWCKPCRIVKDELKNKNSELSMVVSRFDVKTYDFDVDKPEFIRYNVSKVPTFIIKDNKGNQDKMTGIGTGIKDLINFLKTHE